MQCREACGACCIAISISSPMPGLPDGKPAGMRCPHLLADYRCALWGKAERPQACEGLRPAPDICGNNRDEALLLLQDLERLTHPGKR